MDQLAAIGAVYIAPALGIIALYWIKQQKKSKSALKVYREAAEAGLLEPASLHPVIDTALCVGCATCVGACPEKDVLGIIKNKAQLISPSSCIGHGACKTACPTQAIELVFGTATRGVDIPLVGEDYQTNVPGIYIAGELGGMGLIRNAIEQGHQAVAAIANNKRRGGADSLDLVIVGAGPAGISAAMAARAANLNFTVLEQDSVGGTIAHYPRGKLVMTQPAHLPLVGEFQFRETTKESLMAFWSEAIAKTGLDISTGERVDSIERCGTGFKITASKTYHASNVLLTIGRRGSPRKLGVSGEEQSKVVYRLVEPEQYRGKKVMVVGGGDSALEAAISLSEEEGTKVTLSYRGSAFNRAKAKNRERVEEAQKCGQLRVELGSVPLQITSDMVRIKTASGEEDIHNDSIIVCAGGILPTAFLEKTGIEVKAHFGAL